MNTLASHCHAVGQFMVLAHGTWHAHAACKGRSVRTAPASHRSTGIQLLSGAGRRRTSQAVTATACGLRPIHSFINRKHMHALWGDKYMHHIIAWICRRYVHTLSPTSDGFVYLLGIYSDVYWMTDMQGLCVLYN